MKILLFLFAANIIQAGSEPLTPVQLNISSASNEFEFVSGILFDQPGDESAKESYLRFMELNNSEFQRIRPKLMRMNFQEAYRLTAFGKGSNSSMILQRAFKTFVIRSTEQDLDILSRLHKGVYLLQGDFSNQAIIDLVQEAEEFGVDHILGQLLQGRALPRLHRLRYVDFYVNFSDIGSVHGAKVDHFNLHTTNLSHPLPAVRDQFSQVATISLTSIFKVYTAEEWPMLDAYLNLMDQVSERKQELTKHGWLEPIKNRDRDQELSLPSVPESDNVIRLFQPRVCALIFRE
jgi:hypothetical protein